MTVYLMISLPRIPYIHCIYMALANPIHDGIHGSFQLNIRHIHCKNVQMYVSANPEFMLRWTDPTLDKPNIYTVHTCQHACLRI